MGARDQYKTLSKVTMFVEGRKWLPLKYPFRRTRAWVLLDVGMPFQSKAVGIWTCFQELGDQAPSDEPAHPDRELEDAPASHHEAEDLMGVVWQPRVFIILLIPIPIAISGIRSIRPLRLEHQDEQRILQHFASGVLHVPLGCFRFHPGLLVLHLPDEACFMSVPMSSPAIRLTEPADSLKLLGSASVLTCVIGLQTLYPLDGTGQVFSDKPQPIDSNFNRKFELGELC